MNDSNMDDDDQRRNMTKIDAEETSHNAKLRRPKKSLSIYIFVRANCDVAKAEGKGNRHSASSKEYRPPIFKLANVRLVLDPVHEIEYSTTSRLA